jgi:hypothetical protein
MWLVGLCRGSVEARAENGRYADFEIALIANAQFGWCARNPADIRFLFAFNARIGASSSEGTRRHISSVRDEARTDH